MAAMHRLVAVLALLAPGCAGPGVPAAPELGEPVREQEEIALGPSEQDMSDILDLLDELELADTNDDVEAVIALYDDDAMWLPPEGGRVSGLPAIRERYDELFQTYDVTMKLVVANIDLRGATAQVTGNATVELRSLKDDAVTSNRDRFIMVVRRTEAGPWKIWRLAWTPAS